MCLVNRQGERGSLKGSEDVGGGKGECMPTKIKIK